MKNKKAFMLGEHTLKVIIAVLCLLLLFYLLFSLYSSYQNEKNLRMAGATLDEISEKMSEAKEKGEVQEVVLLEPRGWILISFDGNKKPNKCISNCICVCTNDEPGFHVVSTELELCNALGVCENFDDKINKFGYQIRKSSLSSLGGILIGSAEELNVNYEENQFFIKKK